jgi:outer membrane protein OmpA-like peptidoglycan-associated protein
VGEGKVNKVLAMVALGAWVVSGCAPRNMVVVLPSPDGHIGQVVVAQGGQETVLDTAYASLESDAQGRLAKTSSSPKEVRQVFGASLAAQPMRPVSFTLYFVEGSDELTPESKQEVGQIFAEIGRRPAPELTVIGHTDRVGSVKDNDALSLKRAERVRNDLIARGIAARDIYAAGRGEREPLVPTADEVPEPRNRRVEISVR